MTDASTVRYRNTVLYDHGGKKVTGDVLLHQDGSWAFSNGDEDVADDIDGSQRLITRSFQNWHTHLAMQLNARDFSDGYPLHRWLNEAIFPTEARITPDYVRMGSRCAAAEMIRTGSTFAADMYFYPSVTGDVLTDAGIRGLIGGPVSDAALPSHDDAASALSELDGLLATNNEERFGPVCHRNTFSVFVQRGYLAARLRIGRKASIPTSHPCKRNAKGNCRLS